LKVIQIIPKKLNNYEPWLSNQETSYNGLSDNRIPYNQLFDSNENPIYKIEGYTLNPNEVNTTL